MNQVWKRYSVGRYRWQQGSTLIEVLISIAIVVLVLVSITAGTTLVTKNRRFSSEQVLTTKYTQEGIEWIKAMRNTMGWTTFHEEVADKGNPSSTLCLPALSSTPSAFLDIQAEACDATQIIEGTNYTRSMRLVIVSDGEIHATSFVAWVDNEKDHQTKAEAVLKEWE